MAPTVTNRDDYTIYSYTYETDYAQTDLQDTLSLPISIFSSSLSGLQAIVRYLHEEKQLTLTEIATLLNRSPKTIWTSYNQTKNQPFIFSENSLHIDVSKFATRTLSVLETIVMHLTQLGYTNVDVARELNIDPRTTWTIKKRAEKKEVKFDE